MPTKFYVYIYRDSSHNFQEIYVGKGCGKRSHIHLKNRDKPKATENKQFMGRLRNMKAAGVEPHIQILYCESEELALLAEEEAIDKYGRADLGTGTLFNHTNGGEGTSGHSHKIETCKQMSDNNKGENNPMFGKYGENHPKFGKKASPQTRQIMSDNNKGENHPMYGKTHSLDSIQKMSNAKKGIPKPKITCPHCSRDIGINMAKKWHFDNCKSRIHPTIT